MHRALANALNNVSPKFEAKNYKTMNLFASSISQLVTDSNLHKQNPGKKNC